MLVPELYQHSIDGVVQDGEYLGLNGLTTWGFRYQGFTCGANATRDYYEVKLMGMPETEGDTAGYEVEFKGFLKLAGPW